MSLPVLDVAQDLLRRHGLSASAETTHTLDDEDGGGTLHQFYVDTSPARAAEMTTELIERLIEQDLDWQGYMVSYVGTRLHAASHPDCDPDWLAKESPTYTHSSAAIVQGALCAGRAE